MAVERTLSIIKPDATARNQTGAVNALIEKAGLRIVAQKRVRWSQAQAEKFYEVHKARPVLRRPRAFMTSGPIVVQVLEGENAVKTYRDVMGATDPAKAAAGTIRKELAESIERNSVHGSDSAENAADRDRAEFQAGGDRRLVEIMINYCGVFGERAGRAEDASHPAWLRRLLSR